VSLADPLVIASTVPKLQRENAFLERTSQVILLSALKQLAFVGFFWHG
jgi:hypothetical protein